MSTKKAGKVFISSLTILSMALMPFIGPFSYLYEASASELPVLVKDINESGQGTDFFDESRTELFEYNGELYFAMEAEDYSQIGEELWKTDGTENGTVLVKDIYEGFYSSDLADFVVMSGSLYFTARTDEYGRELWKTDGTEEGTVMVKDIFEGDSSAQITRIVALEDKLLFRATDDGSSYTMWVSDGTEEGTTEFYEVADLIGNENSDFEMVAVGSDDNAYFVIFDYNTYEYYLGVTDGNEMGTTTLIEDSLGDPVDRVYIDDDDNELSNFVVIDDVAYFSNQTDDFGRELWKYDPEDGFATMVLDIAENDDSSEPDQFRPMGVNGTTTLFFVACGTGYDCEPWQTDGTEEGTQQLVDIVEGSEASHPNLVEAKDGYVFFDAQSEEGPDALWYTDGGATTSLIYTMTEHEDDNDGIESAVFFEGALYFSLCSEDESCELFKTNAEFDGIELVMDIWEGEEGSDPDYLTSYDGSIIFQANDGPHGDELWISDGTENGTELLADMVEGTQGSGGEGLDMVVVGDLTFFTPYDDAHGEELWVTDGTEGGTELVKDINGNSDGSNIQDLTAFGEYVLFTAYLEDDGSELWISDGTEGGTEMVKDIREGSDSSSIDDITVVGDIAFFRASDDDHGTELWKTDGTEEGTVIVKDIYEGSSGSDVDELIEFNGKVYFRASTELYGAELWTSDGTAEGTYMVNDSTPADDYSWFPDPGVVMGGELYFPYHNEATGDSLWKTDGTEEGTVLVKDLDPLDTNESVSNLYEAGGNVYFEAYTNDHGYELWVSDGSESGTRVLDIVEGAGSSNPDEITPAGNLLYFIAEVEGAGTELWVTNGTEEGTYLVEEIAPGSEGSNPENLVATGNSVYFSADNTDYDEGEGNGREPWVSDGTAEGTFMIEDMMDGYQDSEGIAPAGSYPHSFTPFLGGLLFFAQTAEYGEELYFIGDVPQPVDEPEEEEPEEEEPSSRGGGGGSRKRDEGTKVAQAVQVATNVAQTAGSVVFNRVLQTGTSGIDVKALQKFLNNNGFPVAPAGPGSKDNETETFGELTRTALAKFQSTNAISPAVGYFGPITKALVEKLMGGATGATTPAANAPASALTSTPTDRSVLELGMSGDDVLKLQNFLIAQNAGAAAQALKANGASGYYGELTKSAVREWQQANAVTPATGNFGPLTKAAAVAKGF